MDKKTADIRNAREGLRASKGKGTLKSKKEFVRRVHARLGNLGINMSRLAKLTGLSRPTLYNVLKGDYISKPETLIRIANALKVHPFWLLEGYLNDIAEELPIPEKDKMQGDRAGFVKDVNFPDGALVSPGSTFYKKWRIQNLGDQVWSGRRLICYDHDVTVTSKKTGKILHAVQALKPKCDEIHLPKDIYPGEVFEVGMEFTAPTISGSFISIWQGVEADGTLCYDEDCGVWCVVHVSTFADVIAFNPHLED